MRLGNKPVKELIEEMEREGVNAFVEALAEEFARLYKKIEGLEKRVERIELTLGLKQ